MPIFEKIPYRVEARQYDGTLESYVDIRAWSDGAVFGYSVGRIRVHTKEGDSYEIVPGAWVIKGIEGEFYPCDEKIFEKTYKEIK